MMITLRVGLKGGPTSGNRGHAGRPGKIGGSVARGVGAVAPAPKHVKNGTEVMTDVNKIINDAAIQIEHAHYRINNGIDAKTNPGLSNYEYFQTVVDPPIIAARDQAIRDALKVDDPVDITLHIYNGKIAPHSYDTASPDTAKGYKDAGTTHTVDAANFVSSVTSKKAFNNMPSASVYIEAKSGRSSYSYGNRELNIYGKPDTTRTIVHELGHHLEASNPDVRNAAVTYRLQRTDYDPIAHHLAGWGKDEYYVHTKLGAPPFVSEYMGKVYGPTRSGPTEVISTALEFLYGNPKMFIQRDPESFKFIINTLRGTSG